MSEALPKDGRIAGIDFGTVRIGVAITDARRQLASPFENYTRRSEQQDAAYFQHFVQAEEIVAFVVGLPVHMSGDESELSVKARAFGDWLTKTTSMPVVFHDERFTSVEAEGLLSSAGHSRKKRKKRLDMVAAQLMLASFLETSSTDMSSRPISDT